MQIVRIPAPEGASVGRGGGSMCERTRFAVVAREAAAHGKQVEGDAVNAVIEEILARPEHAWKNEHRGRSSPQRIVGLPPTVVRCA